VESGKLGITPGTYRIDPVHSSVGFAVMHKVSKFRGAFSEFDAVLTVESSGEMMLVGSSNVGSIQVKDGYQAADLLSPNFFDADRFPVITFRSTSVRVEPDGELAVTGELTLRDQTREVRASGTLSYVADDGHARELLGVDLEAVVDRTDFGISFAQRLPGGGIAVENAVTLSVELELTKG
jgi:polyisoprenoid-binding protein YceI